MTREEHASRPRRESLAKRLGARRVRAIVAAHGDCCVYCGGPREHLDHLVPRARGGADSETNLAPACRRCNSARGAMTLPQWQRYAATVYGLSFSARAILARARRAA